MSAVGIALFLLIFLWTPPHFWALALYRSDDYRRAGVPMLPVVAGPRETKRQMLLYTLVLVPVALAPTLLGAVGWLYGARGAGAEPRPSSPTPSSVWRTADDRRGFPAARRMFRSRCSISPCCSRRCRSIASGPDAGRMSDAMADDRRPGDTDRHRRQRSKNLFMFVFLLALAVIFFVLTLVRMGGQA